MHRLSIVAALSLIALTSSQAQGVPKSASRGFFAGLGLNGSSIDDDVSEGSKSGGGASLTIGYGFTTRFALLLEVTGAEIDNSPDEDFTLTHGDVLARFSFANEQRRWIPYLEAGFTDRVASRDDVDFIDSNGTRRQGELEVSGGAVAFGGGLLYYVSRHWALNTNVKFTSGEFNTVRVNNVSIDGLEIDATTSRFTIGVAWFPKG